MIAAVCWVRKGVAQAIPESTRRTQQEIQDLLGAEDIEDADAAISSENEGSEDGEEEMEVEEDQVATALAAASALGVRKSNGASAVADELSELHMEDYDNEDEDVKIFGNGGLGSAYYQNGENDPYLVDEEDDDEEEIDDKRIRPSDLIILTARNEEDVGNLEVVVYEEGQRNMYVHHEILLPDVPLCISWLDINPKGGEKGNFVAIGTMQPGIYIMDLDVEDVEPVVELGGALPDGAESSKRLKKEKKKKTQLKEDSHAAAILGLSWNEEFRNVLASGSADKSVKIWDVVTQKCGQTLHLHSKEVQSVAWNPKESSCLLSGSFDASVVLTDIRAQSSKGLRWEVSKDVECLAWNPHVSHSFVVSSEDGVVHGFDIRKASTKKSNSSLFTIHAHDKAACAVSYNMVAPNLLATASSDKTIKLWDLANDTPSCIASTNPEVGAVFSVLFCKDSPFLLAAGGSKGKLHIWNTLEESEVARRFQNTPN